MFGQMSGICQHNISLLKSNFSRFISMMFPYQFAVTWIFQMNDLLDRRGKKVFILRGVENIEILSYHNLLYTFIRNECNTKIDENRRLQWTQLHTMANNTVSETTTVRTITSSTITINVCKIHTAVKLQVQHGQKWHQK